MKGHGLNSKKKLISDCSKLFNFLNRPLKSNMLKYANEIKNDHRKNIKMMNKFTAFHLFHSFWSCLNVGTGLVHKKKCYREKKWKWKNMSFFMVFSKRPDCWTSATYRGVKKLCLVLKYVVKVYPRVPTRLLESFIHIGETQLLASCLRFP